MKAQSPLQLENVRPANTLLERVLAAVYQRQERSRLWRVRLFASSAALSIVALVPVGIGLVNAFKDSNFSTYMSLVFSDGGVVLSYWKDIGASLIESLPAISIGVTLALVGILLWSVQKMVRFMNSGTLRTA